MTAGLQISLPHCPRRVPPDLAINRCLMAEKKSRVYIQGIYVQVTTHGRPTLELKLRAKALCKKRRVFHLNLNRFIRNHERRGADEGRRGCAIKIAWEASLLNVNN